MAGRVLSYGAGGGTGWTRYPSLANALPKGANRWPLMISAQRS